MAPRYLLDTHVVVRWLAERTRLSREQARILEQAARRGEPLALSTITLLEIALLAGERHYRLKANIEELLSDLATNPIFQILPLTIEIAREVSMLGAALRDPADRVIVASARSHSLRLLTSDQRIVESKLVPVIE